MQMIWQGEELHTYGDISEALFTINRHPDRAYQAAYFMREYRLQNEYADENIGYLLGYVEPPALRRSLYELFKVVHPIAKTAV